MYLLTIVAVTTEENPDHGKVGEAYVTCWINTDDEAAAVETAHRMIESDGWNVVETEEVDTVTADDYDDDDPYLACYEQALTDGEVLVFHISPMYPVYRLVLEVSGTNTEDSACEAIAWVSNEAVSDDYDPMEPDFWSGERVNKAISLATDTISENGYTVMQVLEQTPCNRADSAEEVHFYDDAEEDGICIVLVQDQDE